ncbi:MAG: ROK family protein [Acidobacteria bacterium]|nr:ROK family protein [Acidobacteriota bacterium]
METPSNLRTLAIDIGGSGVKCLVLDHAGEAITERLRESTPDTPTPDAVMPLIEKMAAAHGEFDRISAGFPGVVVDGEIRTAVNLHDSWVGYNLERGLEEKLGKPARVANDADVQGLGVIEGRGVELVLTLGTGVGSALFTGGRLVPNLELGHHPFEKDKSYEERLGDAELRKKGVERWNKRLERAIAVLDYIFNFRMLYLGGGNAKKIDFELPQNVQKVQNIYGLLGGIRLWEPIDHSRG